MKEVKRITYQDTKPFILNIHYAKRMPIIKYAFGLFEDGDLIGIITYGQPSSPSLSKSFAGDKNKSNILELNRLCFKPNYNGDNRASFLISHSLKLLPRYTFVVSYADTGQGHTGYVYQAANFYFWGTTKERTDIYSKGHARHYLKEETRRQTRTAKHRYVYFVGTRKDVKQMKKEVKYKITKEYPKGMG